jgi:hypothetical protein
MSSNPYAPPTADVGDIEPEVPRPVFFPVSLVKLGVLSVCTLGIYQIYWFYQNWRLVQAREGTDISPVWRGIFGVFFCRSLFQRVREHGMFHGITPAFSVGGMAAGWIIATLGSRLPDPYWLITFTSILFLFPVQSYVNRINLAVVPGHEPNDRFTGWNWFGVVVGGVFLFLVAVAFMLPEEVG